MLFLMADDLICVSFDLLGIVCCISKNLCPMRLLLRGSKKSVLLKYTTTTTNSTVFCNEEGLLDLA